MKWKTLSESYDMEKNSRLAWKTMPCVLEGQWLDMVKSTDKLVWLFAKNSSSGRSGLSI